MVSSGTLGTAVAVGCGVAAATVGLPIEAGEVADAVEAGEDGAPGVLDGVGEAPAFGSEPEQAAKAAAPAPDASRVSRARREMRLRRAI